MEYFKNYNFSLQSVAFEILTWNERYMNLYLDIHHIIIKFFQY